MLLAVVVVAAADTRGLMPKTAARVRLRCRQGRDVCRSVAARAGSGRAGGRAGPCVRDGDLDATWSALGAVKFKRAQEGGPGRVRTRVFEARVGAARRRGSPFRGTAHRGRSRGRGCRRRRRRRRVGGRAV